jgi:two-component system, sensor histidine kinase and response regulator
MSNPPSDQPPIEILIAEDSPTQAQRLRYILEQQGYLVTHATNGRLAWEAARLRKPTLVISDVIMPEMTGYELCRRLKEDEHLGDIPVILVTTLSDPEDVIRGLECHADNFILKPYEEHYLLGRVRFVLLNREIRRIEPGGMGVEIFFNGHRHFITADRLQILNLLLSTYDAAIQRNKELIHAKENLHRLNTRLETANKELESFAYSVSHDLRAPLRHITGFAGLLEQNLGNTLDEGNRRDLAAITDAAKQMEQLIEDLLAFSRMARAEMRRTWVDLDDLVDKTLAGMQAEVQGRNIIWKRSRLPLAQGDAALLKQVFVNLLSNAIKYTRNRNPAEIEIGCNEDEHEFVIHIRDNGAGFDMRYADRLFGVFERLHRVDEFEGTGIGLASVRRIVQRHDGRTWAEGKPDAGATFYFSLPKNVAGAPAGLIEACTKAP